MARKAQIQKAETWVYIDDVEETPELKVAAAGDKKKAEKVKVPKVFEIAAGKQPPGGGSTFMVGPVPHDLYLEIQLYGSTDANVEKIRGGRLPSELLAAIVESVLQGWAGVEGPDGEDMEFKGPESTALLDPETKTLLGNWSMARTRTERATRGKPRRGSGNTRS